jgi:hypothetical protein
LLAWALGGANDRRNLVPLYPMANQGFGTNPVQMRSVESTISKALVNQRVYYLATPIYSDSGNPYIPQGVDIFWETPGGRLRSVYVKNVP